MEKLLCPSKMCANFASLKKEIKDLERRRIDIFPSQMLWIRDFVPNFGIGYKISNISIRQQ